MEIHSQNISIDRKPAVAGTFYSADKDTLLHDISAMFADCKKVAVPGNVRAIICPHAGYIFSGEIAASAFSATPKDAGYKNIFIIGSSHIMSFNGASVYDKGDFITPLGKVTVNREIADELKKSDKVFNFPVDAHTKEHSLEMQVPLIQYYYKPVPEIVPIIIGTDNTLTIKKIASILKQWFVPGNLFVISSDFSHYPPYNYAVINDNLTAEALMSGNPDTFLSIIRKNASANIPGLLTSMCGWTSGLVLLDMAEGNKNLSFRKIDYCNSGDSPYGDKERVVGYNAIALVDKAKKSQDDQASTDEFRFSEKDREQLFSIARNTIKARLFDNVPYKINADKMPASLKRELGAFVTLKINGGLRGCIGRFVSTDPLYDVVRASALSSAFEDPRFPPLTRQEYDKVDIEITILGPLQKINNIKEIILGKHGIYIKKDLRSGTMLPQVPIENGWTLEEFLGYTSRDKAGLGWNGWKDADIYIYEGLVLEENK